MPALKPESIAAPVQVNAVPKKEGGDERGFFGRIGKIAGNVTLAVAVLFPSHGVPENGDSSPRTKVSSPAEKQLSPAEKKEKMREKLNVLVKERVNFRRIGDLQKEGHRCLDGRCKCQKGKEVVGGAGGGAGDIAAAVVALKNMGYDLMEDDTMRKVIDAHPSTIYRHTDTHALEALEHAVAEDPVLHEIAQSREAVRKLLENGTKNDSADERLLEKLSHVGTDAKGRKKLDRDGCGHEGYMGGNPELYGMTPELFRKYNDEMYRELWEEGEHEVIDPLEGDHGEEFAVGITYAQPIENADSQFPAFSPSDQEGKNQVFAFHPQFTEFALQQYAAELKAKVFPELNAEKFVVEALSIAEKQFNATGSLLAKDMPLLMVHFKSPTEWTIEDKGTIQ